jgi:hypothetical protein
METEALPEILLTAPAARVPAPSWARLYRHQSATLHQIRALRGLPALTVVQAKAPASLMKQEVFLRILAERAKHAPFPWRIVFLFDQGRRLKAGDFSSVLRLFPTHAVEFAQGARDGAVAVEGAWAKILKERAEDPRRDPLGQITSVVRATADLRAESGRLSADRVAEAFGLSVAEVAKILGASRQAVSKTPDAQALQEGLRHFERIARLRTVLPTEDFRKWLNMPRQDLKDRSPLELVRGRKASVVADLVEDMLTGAPV